MALEIERKFLVAEFPSEASNIRPVTIRQGYVASSDASEVRIRQADRAYFLTLKKGQGLERRETEIEITQKQFESLLPEIEGELIQKKRYKIPLGLLVIELDVFEGSLKGLFLAEVEFGSQDQATVFESPYWFGPDVTSDTRFSNKKLSVLREDAAKKEFGPLLNPPQRSFGIIPFVQMNGENQVVIVTTKASNRWVFPKGTPESNKSPQEIALTEGIEEAGIEGVIVGDPIYAWHWKDLVCFRIEYYPMEVHVIRTKWLEDSERKRLICNPSEAKKLINNASISMAMDKAALRLQTKSK